MADLGGLTADEKLLYWTGAAARLTVMIEHQLNQVFAALTGPVAIALAPSGVPSHADAIKRLVDADSFLDEELKETFRSLIVEVKEANSERNRLVHDLWWEDLSPDAPPEQFTRTDVAFSIKTRRDLSPRSLGDFEKSVQRLTICTIRLTAAGMLVGGHFLRMLGRPMPGFGPKIDADNRRIAAGQIRYRGDGSFEIL